jgi:hypothetical protein
MDIGIARARPGSRNLFQNSLWGYDNYPELRTLDAHSTVELASFTGPGVITQVHVTRLLMGKKPAAPNGASEPLHSLSEEEKAAAARGVWLEIAYDGEAVPSVRCPLADFFADGCGGRSIHYSTPFMEKLPEAYNCYAPMPFRREVRIALANGTDLDLMAYAFVEAEALPAWEPGLRYFRAAWRELSFQLTPDTDLPLLSIDGPGHLVGSQLSVRTEEPSFKEFHFVMEGNCEHRVDGEAVPSIDYLGTEDSFGFSWGFQREFCGQASGISFLRAREPPFELSIYRFRQANPIRFERSLDVRINWRYEYTEGKRQFDSPVRQALWKRAAAGGCQMDYACTWWWYGAAGE